MFHICTIRQVLAYGHFLALRQRVRHILWMTKPHRSIPALGILSLMTLAACDAGMPPSVGDGPGLQSAYFAEFPTPLFDVLGSRCFGATDRLSRPSRTELVCESLPSPEAAAALIL